MSLDQDQSAVDNLNLALALYRRLLLRLGLIFVLGLVAVILAAKLSSVLSPPTGVRLFGEGLSTWVLILGVVVLIGEIFLDGRRIGRALGDPLMSTMPVIGLMSVPTVIAQRATAMGMEWTGFYGPLRPARSRGRS